MAVVTHQIEVKYRGRTGTNKITVQASGGASHDVLIDTQWYHTFSQLVSELQTKLQAADGNYTLGIASTGKVTLARSGGVNFSVTWRSLALRDALGFEANLSGAQTYTSTTQSPYVFKSSLPWYNDTPSLTYARKMQPVFRSGSRSIKLGKLRHWFVTARAKHAELEQWRKVTRLLMRGCPARWFRNSADVSAWSWTNFDGYVDVVLAADGKDLVDLWPGFPLQKDLETSLSFVEWQNEIEEEGGGGGFFGGG